MHTATSSDKIEISSEKQTEELAKKIQKKLKLGDVVFLYGEIGVGKTTFVRYLINFYEKKNKVKLSEVTSPTYNLLNEYNTKNFLIKHYDLFRVKNSSEINDLDIFEKNSKTITFIEWPELLGKNSKIKSIDLLFTYENELKNRTVHINGLN